MTETCVECPSSHSNAQVASEPLAVLAARAGCALEASIVRCADKEEQTLGHLEVQAAHDVKELLRAALERGAQAKADGAPPLCPVCQQKLTRLSVGHPRTFQTRYGARTGKRGLRTSDGNEDAPRHLGPASPPPGRTRTEAAHRIGQTSSPSQSANGTDAGTLPDDHSNGRLEHSRTRSLGPERGAAPPGTRTGTVALGIYWHGLSPGSPRAYRRRTACHQRARFCGHTPGHRRAARTTARRSNAERLAPGGGRVGHR